MAKATCTNFIVKVRGQTFGPWIPGEQSVEGKTAVKPFLFAFMTKSFDIKNDAFII